MKQYYIFLSLLVLSLNIHSQGYEFGLVHNGNYNFSVIAIPDFDATDTDISDIGFALMLPTGDVDVVNISQFNSRAWTATEVTATQLTGLGLGDGTRDGFAMNLPPGQTIMSHTSGQEMVLVSFDVTNMPTAGIIEILTNTDPIAIGLGGAVDSFYNSNVDETTTQNYFSGLVSGQESISFETLGVIENTLEDTSITVGPNPTSSFVTIHSKMQIMSIDVYNILGELIVNTDAKIIDLSEFNSGVYLLRIKTLDNKIFIKRIVKE